MTPSVGVSSAIRSTSSNARSVARRVTAIGIAMMAVVLLALSLAVAYITTQATRSQLVGSVTHATVGLVASIDTVEQANRRMVERSSQAFARYFSGTMDLEDSMGLLYSDGIALNDDFSVVDRFSEDTGGVATIFARKGDDFQRIATSLRNLEGERVMNTLLDRNHPAYQLIRSGKTYTGRANLFGKPYMTRYEPVRDSAGQTVGILFVGTDLTAFQEGMQQQVANMRLFEHGGSMVIDPAHSWESATFVAHAQHSGKKVLEVFPQAREFLQVLSNNSDGFAEEVMPLLPNQGAQPWSVMRKTQEGWWVISEVSDQEAMASQRRALWAVWGAMGLALLALAGGLFWTLHSGVSRPLRELTQTITRVSRGDLTQPFSSPRRDEVGDLVREIESMRQRYVQMLRQVSTAAHSIASASSQIAQGNQDLSERTESTAERLARTAQSVEQVTHGVRQSADAASQAHQLSASAVDVASRGGHLVGQVVSTMGEINDSSRKIGDIIGVIDGIAFQTNILALNAAVEAARAGEQGRGFAVVASEVRNLAQRSAEAAKEIKLLINTSVSKAESGARLVEDAGQTMDDIVRSVQRMGDIIGDIAAASSEQAQSIALVNQDVAELDQMTQQNAALVEESTSASQSMRVQANQLESSVAVFKLPEEQADSMLRL
ncbi:MAG: Cache 3/Cache 2 fusion domain-containing protein [Comamonas sp.]|nr:Cache 3/Cache 2 fusion domain-containing protein [Comamonas sp.]